MLGARLAEKDNHGPHALRAFLDNNVHNNFIAVGMGEQQRLEIERLRRELDTVTIERNSLKRRLEESNDAVLDTIRRTRTAVDRITRSHDHLPGTHPIIRDVHPRLHALYDEMRIASVALGESMSQTERDESVERVYSRV